MRGSVLLFRGSSSAHHASIHLPVNSREPKHVDRDILYGVNSHVHLLITTPIVIDLAYSCVIRHSIMELTHMHLLIAATVAIYFVYSCGLRSIQLLIAATIVIDLTYCCD